MLKKEMKVFLFFPLILFSLKVSQTNGQQTAESIEGVVYNSNQETIENAYVRIEGTDTEIRANSNGRFLLENVALGTSLTISAEGYVNIHKKVDTFGKIYALLYRPDELEEERISLPISENRTEQIFTAVEKQPQFPGGNAEMYRFINQHLNYPPEAKAAKIEGRVFVKFVVQKDGSISQTEIMKGLGHGYDEEALRIIKLMPKWKAGTQNGRTVNVWYTLAFSFSLEE
ncbi:TonB family protein [Jiulongibacter sediminis]|uniref:TonB family protein n=1 Tax=Jiulongibacter sediminis TaxID=1605367 RepID=UPI00103FBB9F|nr:TonB family protein [Jiulongibacter sediminis]